MNKNQKCQRVKDCIGKTLKKVKENKVLILSFLVFVGFIYLKTLEEEHSSD